jgi:hypothetical protein
MNVGDWVRSRTPAPPEAMTSRVIASLGDRAGEDAGHARELCLDSAIRLLDQLLQRNALERSTAVDLLAADALVTYAFEAAAADPDRLDDHAAEAMVRLAALAERDEQPAPER